MTYALVLSAIVAAFSAPVGAPKGDKGVAWHVTALPRTGAVEGDALVEAVLVEEEPGVERYVLGSLRLELRNGKALFWGEDRPLGFIAGAVEADGGWHFVSSDGSFMWSKSFLGTLTRTGQVDRVVSVPASLGRAVAVDIAGGLWSAPAGKGPALVSALKGYEVLDAAFASAEVGMAVVAPGRLLFTGDGGASWAEVDLDDNVAMGVSLEKDGLTIDTLDGRLTLDQEGQFVEAGRKVTLGPGKIEREKLERTLWRKFPERLAHLPTLADGTIADISGRTLLLRDPRTGAVSSKVDDMLPQGSSRGCQAIRFRGAVAFLCPSDEAPQASLWVTSDGKKAKRLVDIYGDVETVVVSRDGASLAFRGFNECQQGATGAKADQLCLLLGDEEEVSAAGVSLDKASILDMYDSKVLLKRDGQFQVVDGATGGATKLDFSAKGGGGVPVGAGLAFDGTPYVVIEPSSGDALVLDRVVVFDGPGGAGRALLLPAGTTAFTMVTAGRILALGSGAADLWSSNDGGKSWNALAVPVSGDGAMVPAGSGGLNAALPLSKMLPLVRPYVGCITAELCVAEMAQSRWIISGSPLPMAAKAKAAPGEAPKDDSDTVLAASTRKDALKGPAKGVAVVSMGGASAALKCEPADPGEAAGWGFELPDGESQVPYHATPFGPVEAGMEYTVNIQGEPRWRVLWNFARKKHNYSTSSKAVVPLWDDWVKPNVQRWRDRAPAQYRLLGGSEGVVWLERCSQGKCRSMAVPSDGAPSWLPSWEVVETPLELQEVAFDGDGTAYAHLLGSNASWAGRLHLLLRIGKDGAVQQRRGVVLPHQSAERVNLAQDGGMYGLMSGYWQGPEEEFAFYSLGGDSDYSVTLGTNLVADSCPPKSEAGLTMWDSTSELSMQFRLKEVEFQRHGRHTIQWAWSQGGWCIAGVDLAVSGAMPDTLAVNGPKPHLDSAPDAPRRKEREPTFDVETRLLDEDGNEIQAPDGSAGDGQADEQPGDGGDSDQPGDDEESGEDDEGWEDEGYVEEEAPAPGGRKITFEDPAAKPAATVELVLGMRLHFASLQGHFTGHAVGGIEPLQLVCKPSAR